MKLRWKKDAKLTGLMSIGASPRGSTYHDGADYYASTSCTRDGKWMWSSPSNAEFGIEWRNSAAEGVYFDDEKQAKIEAKKYVDECINKSKGDNHETK